MRVLMFSTDKAAFDQASETRRRFTAYGDLVESLHIIVIGADQAGGQDLSERVKLYPIAAGSKPVAAWKAFRKAWDIIKKEKIGLVVAQSPLQTGILGYLLAKLTGIKLLVSVYGADIFDPHWVGESWKRRPARWLGRIVLAGADAMQTDGFETVESLKQRFGDRVFWKPVVPADITLFTEASAKLGGGDFRMLFVGRLVKQKNLPMLLDVLSSLASQRPAGWRATLVGDGPLRPWLEHELEKRGLSDKAKYVPKLSRQEMARACREHQALICTSAYEGFARIFLEAAASGLPIVTTRVSGVANLVEDGVAGFVVGQNDAKAFTERLMELMDKPDLWQDFSRNLAGKFRGGYSFQVTMDRQKEIFDFLGRL